MKEKFKRALRNYRENAHFRAEIMLCIHFAVNLIYAVFQASCGIFLRSLWNGTLAFYYIALSAIRLFLLIGCREEREEKQWEKYRNCGAVMLVLTLALFGIHCLTLYQGHSIVYRGYMIYSVALYTFYAVGNAIRNIVIYRKINHPVFSAGKALSLVASAMGIYSLQSAMNDAFGDSKEFREIMGNCVCIGVFLLIVALSLFMILKGERKRRKYIC